MTLRPHTLPKQIEPGKGLVFLTGAIGSWLLLYAVGYGFLVLVAILERMS